MFSLHSTTGGHGHYMMPSLAAKLTTALIFDGSQHITCPSRGERTLDHCHTKRRLSPLSASQTMTPSFFFRSSRNHCLNRKFWFSGSSRAGRTNQRPLCVTQTGTYWDMFCPRSDNDINVLRTPLWDLLGNK